MSASAVCCDHHAGSRTNLILEDHPVERCFQFRPHSEGIDGDGPDLRGLTPWVEHA